MGEGYEEDGGATIDDLAGLYRCGRELLDERDALRARMLELESQVGEREQHLRDALKDMRAERDRLRVVVDAAKLATGRLTQRAEYAETERVRLRAAMEVLTECQTCGMVARLALDGLITLDASAEATDG